MKISLIGMSGTGKSYWAKKLETKNFKRFCIDDLIEEKLGEELKNLGFNGISDVAKWMGQPFDKQYPTTSKRYLDLEQEVLDNVLQSIEKVNDQENIVIDTTGSVIYLHPSFLKKLSRLTTVVFLETPESVKQQMYQLFLKEPKPLIWGNIFHIKKNETENNALKRCYPELLAYRTKQYEQLADVTLDYFELRDPKFTIDDFLQKIKQ